ncbi:PREDICTED: uncharacterized protein LOC105140690 isoform X2 [Populus euphratica]|nr:PREDICTED: uncharacterized protein LOC105140690 isoform X2 [Populus euphratica]
MREVLPKPAEDTVDGVASDSCQMKNTEVDKMSKEGIAQDHYDTEPCNLRQPLCSFSVEPIKATKDDLSLEEMVVAEIHEKLVSRFKEIHSEGKQVQPEKLDTPEEKDLSIAVLSSTSYDLLESNSLTEVIPIDKPSSKSVNLVYSNESKVPELGFTSSETSAESIRQLDNSTEDAAKLGLSCSCTVKLDGSCFIIYCNELSSVSFEAGQLWSSKERTANQVFNQGPAQYRNLGPESSHRREGFASSFITTPDDSFPDSEWVIV